MPFGFERGTYCTVAIFAFTFVVTNFVNRCSSIMIVSIDVSKAFVRDYYFKLRNSLLAAGIPHVIVKILCSWKNRLFAAVLCINNLSVQFAVRSGVRLGSTPSCALLRLY